MKEFSLNALMFLGLLAIQVGLVTSLPWPLNTLPVLFAVTVYLVQHHGLLSVVWWPVGYGLWLDLFGLHGTPVDTIPYLAATTALFVLLRRFFSNRSWYGILACGITVLLVKDVVSLLILFIGSLFGQPWDAFLPYGMLWELLFCAVLLSICFQFANRIRLLLRRTT